MVEEIRRERADTGMTFVCDPLIPLWIRLKHRHRYRDFSCETGGFV